MTLFLENIELLLESEDGPVGQLIRQKAEEVQALVQQDVREIMHRLPDSRLQELVDQVAIARDGADAEIGIINTGQEIAEYLADKAVREQDKKLTKAALAQVFP